MSEWLLWAIAGTTFVFGAFYSGAETAFIAADRIRLRHLAAKGNRRAHMVLRFLDNPEFLLSAVLVGTNLAVIGCTTIFTAIATRHFGDAGDLYATLILVPLFLLFNEIIPKGLFLYYANRAALSSVYVLRGTTWVLYPVIKVMALLADLLTGALSSQAGRRGVKLTMEEMMFHIGDSEEAGLISRETRGLANRAIDLTGLTAKDVLVPLEKVVMVQEQATSAEFSQAFIDSGFSRLPVFRESRSNVVGIVSVHELMKAHAIGEVRSGLIEPYVIFLDTPIVEVLFEMQTRGRHMAMVRDSGGEVTGMVTLEDILERFVGAIVDEYH